MMIDPLSTPDFIVVALILVVEIIDVVRHWNCK